jgi:hypothetical protein
MTALPIDIAGHKRPHALPNPGPAPIQQWIEIALLRVDPAYQRPIRSKGAQNVRRIAEAFCWQKFAPVVVAPIEGGFFAIVDGQHRATAAAVIGIERVPCHIIQADPAQQAAAFSAINGNVTPMFAGALWHARREAGDVPAVLLASVLEAAEVTICRYPLAAQYMKPGETLAVGALQSALARYGRDTLITALQCVTQTGDGNPGMLRAAIISALCKVLHNHPRFREAGARLLEVMDDLDFETVFDTESLNRRSAGVLSDRIADAILKHLVAAFGPAPAMAFPAPSHASGEP